MLLYIQSFLIVVFEILCCKIFFQTFCEKPIERKKFWDNIVTVILILFVFYAGNCLKEYLVLKEVLIIIVTALLMYSVLQISLFKSFLLSVLFQALLLVVDYLTLLMAVTLFESTTNIEENYLAEGALTIALGKMILILCVILIRQRIGKKTVDLLRNDEWLKFIFFPIFSICIILAMINAIGGMKNQKAEEVCFVIAIGLAGMNILVFYLINDILEREYKIRENELFKMQVRNQTELYHSISENFEKQRKKTHEYKNQILCIDSLIANKNYSELEQYVRNISGILNKELDAINTNHVIVNAILNTKYREAIEKNILFIIKISDLSDIKISDEDVVIILSNLLNNAIEACEKCERKVIKLKFIKENENIVLSVKNAYQGQISYCNGEIITTKSKEKEQHGIGINNIIETIKKYDGSYVIKDENEEFYFSIVIPE